MNQNGNPIAYFIAGVIVGIPLFLLVKEITDRWLFN